MFLFLFLALLAPQEKPAGIPLAKLDRKDPIVFSKDVAPILAAKCLVCHAGKNLEGDYDMTTPATLLKGGKRGAKVLVPGNAEASFFWTSSAHRVKPIMPPKSESNPLTSMEVTILKRWIDEGAKVAATEVVRTKTKVVLDLPPALVTPIRAAAIAPDKRTIYIGRANRLHVFSVMRNGFVKSFVDPELVTPSGKPAKAAHLSLIETMALSPDGKRLAVGSFQEVTIWNTETGRILTRIGGLADRVSALAYHPDGKLLAVGGGAATEDGELKLFDATDGKLVTEIKPGHSDTVFGVAFSPDGKLLATSGADKFVKVWDVPSGKFAKSFEGHTAHVLDVAWSPDGKRILSAGADNFVKVWDYEKGEKLRDIQGFKNQVTRLVAVPKLADVIAVGGDGLAKTITAEGGQGRSYADAKDFLYVAAVSPDGTLLMTGGEEGILRLYDRATGKLLKAATPVE